MYLGIENSFTIAFVMRSGSNQLCRLLARRGFGRPGELFQTVPNFHNQPTSSVETWLAALIADNEAGGVFGSKMAHDHRARLDEALRLCVPGYNILDDVFPRHKWIWLRRRDKIAQAVSLYIAEETARWSQEAGSATVACEYCYVGILSALLRVLANDFTWETYFSGHSLTPYKIWYEEFFSNVEEQLSKLTVYMGDARSPMEAVQIPDLAVQRDGRSERFADRFRRDLNRVGEESFARESSGALVRWNAFFFERSWNATPSR